MSTESPEPYIRNDRHVLAHVRADGYFAYHPVEQKHRRIWDMPGHPVRIDANWAEVSPRARIVREQASAAWLDKYDAWAQERRTLSKLEEEEKRPDWSASDDRCEELIREIADILRNV